LGGNDTLYGEAGDDTLEGGDGNDIFHYDFEVTEGTGGSERFTDWLEANGMGAYVGADGQLLDGTGQGTFSSQYTAWLEHLVETYDLAGGQAYDIELNQNTTGVASVLVDGVDVMAGLLSEGEDFTFTAGKSGITQTRYYSDLFSFGSELSVTSDDGHDTIADFEQGEDKLDFSDLTFEQFESLFSITPSDADGDGVTDTVLTITGDDSWSLTLLGVTGLAASTSSAESDILFADTV